MATIDPVRTETPGRTFHYIWETMTETNDVGNSIQCPGARDRSIQCHGTFGGAAVELYGSNMLEPVLLTLDHWSICHDAQYNEISLTDNVARTGVGLNIVLENMLWYKLILVGGSSTDLDVELLAGSVL